MIFPIEILREVSKCNHVAYNILVRTCKGIAMPVEYEIKYFTRLINNEWRMPYGELHVGLDVTIPSIRTDDYQYWYYQGLIHSDPMISLR